MIPIEDKKRVDWNAIRAEYIGGGVSQRKLANKYGVSETTLMKKANAEGWCKMREKAESKSTARAQQRTAEAAADNAVVAARIKKKLLLRLEKEIDRLPEEIGSETWESVAKQGTENGAKANMKKSRGYKLRDFTAAYVDLTSDMLPSSGNTNELLQGLYGLFKKND